MNFKSELSWWLTPLLAASIADCDAWIATTQKSLSLLHRSHPARINHVEILAVARLARYTLSHQREDLDKSILHYAKAILLLPIHAKPSLNVSQAFFRLAFILLDRSEEFEQPDGIKYAIEYLQYIRRLPQDSINVPRTLITTSLTRALRAQVTSDAGNWTQDIKEMVVLCNELISSNKSEDVPNAAFIYLDQAVTHIAVNHAFPTEMLDEIIECLRNVVKVCPLALASYEIMFALAKALNIRFMGSHSKEDYEEATVVLERILEPGGCPDSFRIQPSALAITLAHGRSVLFGEPEYSELAISRLRAESSSSSLDGGLRAAFTSSLELETRRRFREYNLNESLEEANSYTSQLINLRKLGRI